MKKLLLIIIMVVTGIVVIGCSTTGSSSKGAGGYGFWVKEKGLLRGTLPHNRNYGKPYRQCVHKDKVWLNKECD